MRTTQHSPRITCVSLVCRSAACCSNALFPAEHSCPCHTKQLSVSSLLPSGCHLCCLIFFNSLTSICWLAAVTPRTLMPHADRYSNPWGSLWGNGVGGTNRNNHQTFKVVRCKGLKCLSPLDAFLVQEAINIPVWAARGKRAEKCKS